LSSLLSFSSTPLSNKLSFAAFVFDSLTTTRTATTPSASKAGLFYELQYETTSASHPTLIGGKLLDHRLERSRISRIPSAGERNFHILYYLVSGASAKDQDHLGLLANGNTAHGVGSRASLGNRRWRYLGHPAQFKAGIQDDDGFKQFQYALRKLEFAVDDIAAICQILATILHLGQLEFHSTSDTTPAANDSGGYSHEGGENVTRVKNPETLQMVGAFLGVSAQDLETMFSYKTRTLHKERVTVMLDPAGAQNSADELARTLYALLVAWIIEAINKRVCAAEEAIHNTISIVDFPGFAKQASSSSQILDQLLNNAATEQLYNVTLTNFFERQVEMLDTEEVAIPPTSYFDNSDAVRGLLKPGNGLLSILDDQAKRGKTDHQFLDAARRRFADKNPAIAVGSSTTVMPGSNFATHNAGAAFTVRHYAGEVDYPVEGLMEANTEVISGDMLTLIGKTRNHFVAELFGQDVLKKVVHPSEESAVMQASIASKPTRQPSMARRKWDRQNRTGAARAPVPEEETNSDPESRTSTFVGGRPGKSIDLAQPGVSSQFLSSLQSITKTLTTPHTNTYFVFCMKSNDKRMTNTFDVKSVRQQLQTFGIVEISQRLRNADFTVFMPFGDFLSRAEGDAIFVGSEREKCEDILTQRRWPANEARCGVTGVFLSERCWLEVADISSVQLPPRTQYVDAETDDEGMTPGSRGFGGSNVHLVPGATAGGYYDDKHGNYFGVKDADLKSDAGASALNGDMFRNLETRSQMAEKANEKSQAVQNVEEHQISGSRKRWMFFVYALTFYIPTAFIKWFGKKKRPDMQVAWREKLAINLLIWLSIAGVMFFMGKHFLHALAIASD
jgi:chitin synthase